MSIPDNQNFETFLPIYDAVPEKWESARAFLVEQFKRISISVNAREIGWHLDQETLTGWQFIPGVSVPGQFRQVFRIARQSLSPVIGVNNIAHGVNVSSSFTLVNLWGSATNAGTLTGTPINQPNITYTSTNIVVTLTAAATRLIVVMEYMQEL